MLLIFWFLLLIILPSFYYPPTFEGFEYPKFIFSFSIFLVSSLIILIKIFRKKITQFNFRFNRTDLLILSFVVIYLTSVFFSVSPYTSLLSGWGPPQGGLFFLLVCLGFYFYLRNLNFNSTHLIQVSWLMILGVMLSLIISLFKELNLWELGVRIQGTQKNPIFYSSYLMLGLPIALSLLITTKNQITKLFLTTISGIILLSLILSLTRSVWITTVIALLIRGYLNSKKLVINRYFISLILVFILTVIIFLPAIKNKLHNNLDFSDPRNSLVSRYFEQTSALKIIKDYPVLGVGSEALDHIYPKYKSIELNQNDWEWFLGTPQIRNYYLHLAATLGLLGAGLFVLIIGNFIQQFLKKLKSFPNDQIILLIGLFSSWLMIVVHYLFYGASITSQLFFWTLLAVLNSKLISQTKVVHFNKIWIPLGVILIVLIQTLVVIDFYSNYLFTKHFFTKKPEQKIAYLEQAISINPLRVSYYRFLVDTQIIQIRELLTRPDPDIKQINNLLSKSQVELDQAKFLDSSDPELFHLQATLSFFKFRATRVEKGVLADIKTAQYWDPTNPTLQDLETQFYLESGDKNLAIDSAQKTLKLKSNYAPAFYHQGEAYKQLKDFKAAILSYQQVFQFNPNDSFAKAEIKQLEYLK